MCGARRGGQPSERRASERAEEAEEGRSWGIEVRVVSKPEAGGRAARGFGSAKSGTAQQRPSAPSRAPASYAHQTRPPAPPRAPPVPGRPTRAQQPSRRDVPSLARCPPDERQTAKRGGRGRNVAEGPTGTQRVMPTS
eukprot:5388107-Prymnesium_polylepis.1